MTVNRELLWAAYPDGYLAMRGVDTVGGWQCVQDNRVVPSRWVRAPGIAYHVQHESDPEVRCARDAGDLLPNLDPIGDPATWACALRDLAEAMWPGENHVNASLRRYKGQWLFGIVGTSRNVIIRVDTDDPAEALALARASLYEERK